MNRRRPHRFPGRRAMACGFLLGSAMAADPVPAPIPPANEAVRQIDDDRYAVGQVTVRKSTREISFDARVNQTGGPIEYLLVTGKGKIHEAVFSTDIRPTDLNVAFKLLGYKSSPELFEIRTADHKPTGRFPEVPEETKILSRIRITASWPGDGEGVLVDVNDLILDSSTGKAPPSGPWLYTGSIITDAGFRAEATGDIVALFTDPSAMINFPGKGRDNDEIWSANPEKLPAKGSPVRIAIRPSGTDPD